MFYIIVSVYTQKLQNIYIIWNRICCKILFVYPCDIHTTTTHILVYTQRFLSLILVMTFLAYYCILSVKRNRRSFSVDIRVT